MTGPQVLGLWRNRRCAVASLVVLVSAGVANGAASAAGPGGTPVVALDARSGAVRWAASVGFPAVGTPPVTADGRVYVSGVSSCDSITPILAALDVKNGRLAWQVLLPKVDNVGGVVGLVAGKGLVTFALSGQRHGLVEALDASTGKVRWTAHPGSGFGFPVATKDALIVRHYLVGASPSNQGLKVGAYDRKTGRLRWRKTFAKTQGAFPLAASAGFVFIETPDVLSAFDARTGQQRWRVPNNADLVGAAGTLVLTSDGSTSVALDARTGRELWRSDIAFPNSLESIVADGNLYQLDNPTELAALNPKTGRARWTRASSGASESVESLVAGSGVVGLQDGGVTVVDARDGNKLWYGPGTLSGGSFLRGPRQPTAAIASKTVYQVRPATGCDWGD